jgi:hypothetical protein
LLELNGLEPSTSCAKGAVAGLQKLTLRIRCD